jgi:glycosyltransferase involved in cell wall biosynthesis
VTDRAVASATNARERRAALLVPTLARGDAVGNDTIGLAEALEALGFTVEVFAEQHRHGTEARDLGEAPAFLGRGRPLAIYQLATQWDRGFDLFRTTRAVRIVRDHNVTPARFLDFLGDELGRVQRAAEQQRRKLAADRGIDLLLAASATNADELTALGAPPAKTAVVPPSTPLVSPIEGIVPAHRQRTSPVALFVGRLAPHKGHRRALRVAATYAELYGAPLALRFVGSGDRLLAPWRDVLAREEKRLGLAGHVAWLSDVDAAELRRLYATSDVFLCCSEHEGFCVPLVEATHLGLPVVATHLPSIRDTIGPDALVLPAHADDDLVATSLHRVATDPELRAGLVRAQRAHVATRFSTAAVRDALAAALATHGLLD